MTIYLLLLRSVLKLSCVVASALLPTTYYLPTAAQQKTGTGQAAPRPFLWTFLRRFVAHKNEMAAAAFSSLSVHQYTRFVQTYQQYPFAFPGKVELISKLVGLPEALTRSVIITFERCAPEDVRQLRQDYSAEKHVLLVEKGIDGSEAPIVAVPRKASGSPLDLCIHCRRPLQFCEPVSSFFYGTFGVRKGFVYDRVCKTCPGANCSTIQYGISKITTTPAAHGALPEVRPYPTEFRHPGATQAH